MTVHASDLPADVRKRLGLDDAKPSKKSRAGVADGDPCPGHCGCGKPFQTALAWESHAKTTGCRHWRIDAYTAAPPCPRCGEPMFRVHDPDGPSVWGHDCPPMIDVTPRRPPSGEADVSGAPRDTPSSLGSPTSTEGTDP